MGEKKMEIVPKDIDRNSCEKALKSGKIQDLSQDLKTLVESLIEDVAKNGRPIRIIHIDEDYTSKEAAELLRFSQGHLYKLLDQGEIPYHLVGTHRRISAIDLLKYKSKLEKNRRDGLREMSQLGQDIEND